MILEGDIYIHKQITIWQECLMSVHTQEVTYNTLDISYQTQLYIDAFNVYLSIQGSPKWVL